MINTIKRRLIKYASKIYDPLVDVQIGSQTIKIPLSHQLRDNIRLYPDYNYNLPRIIKYIYDRDNTVKVIDIGANIGDTVAFIKNHTDVPVLCIDGEEKYINILRSNTEKYNNVSICLSLVGEETKESNVQLITERGTAYVETTDKITKVRSLENILEEYSDFSKSKVLKIDTDGFDTLILRGCSNYLKNVKPVLFFEFDPYLVRKNNDDPFTFISYLESCDYKYLMFYMNNGDFLLSCEITQKDIINQLIHYFSGRNIAIFTDVCAFSSSDKELYELSVKNEIEHFRKARRY